jgi:L-threonylcarbamoyladenylate synthase
MSRFFSLSNIQSSEIQAVCQVLQEGKILAYPTDTIYGLGVDIFNPEAVAALIRLKGRALNKPMSILFATPDRAITEFSHLNSYQIAFIRIFLPGPVTLVLPVRDSEQFPDAFVQDGWVGIRIVNLENLNRILYAYERPIATTSANPTGKIPAINAAMIAEYFVNDVAIILDNGPRAFNLPSTVIKVFDATYQIIRPGRLCSEEIARRAPNR